MNPSDFILFVKQWKNLNYKKKVALFEAAYGISPEYIDEFCSDLHNLLFSDFRSED